MSISRQPTGVTANTLYEWTRFVRDIPRGRSSKWRAAARLFGLGRLEPWGVQSGLEQRAVVLSTIWQDAESACRAREISAEKQHHSITPALRRRPRASERLASCYCIPLVYLFEEAERREGLPAWALRFASSRGSQIHTTMREQHRRSGGGGLWSLQRHKHNCQAAWKELAA
jgi:hypothetical protein